MKEWQRVKEKVEHIGDWDDIEYAMSSAGLIDASERVTERQVRQAGLLRVYGNDPERDCRVAYKHIGESLSDNAFVGAIEVKDGKEWLVVYKKYSDSFGEVKITWDKIEEIYSLVNKRENNV